MSTTLRSHHVNPRLGIHFGIAASLIAALFLLLLIMEQLGTSDSVIRIAVLTGPPLLFLAIALFSVTAKAHEYFAAGRRVPAVCSGLVLAVSATGSTGMLAWTGALYFNGFDAWCIPIGVSTGFVIMGIAIAPYMRKSGAYTVPSLLARRFQSRLLRITAASVFVVPMLLVLCAELRMTFWAASLLAPIGTTAIMAGVTALLATVLVLGGLRALGWVGTAQAITVFIAIIVLAAMLGVLMTNFPVSQFSYGPVMRALARLERAQQLADVTASLFAFGIAGNGLGVVTTRFAEPNASVGAASFALTSLIVAAGIAASPWLLPRSGTTSSVYAARKSAGWAVFFFGLLVLTLSALAVFMRDYLLRDLVGRTVDDLPAWFVTLRDLGLASANAEANALGIQSFALHRDAVLYALPHAAGYPAIVLYLTLAGVIAAGLAAAGAAAYAISSLLAEDVIGGLNWEPPSDALRVGIARVTSGVVLLAGLLFVALIETDPLRLVLWALALSAAAAFPVVILSVWWKRLTPHGALASILTGFGIAVAAILLAETGILPLPSELAAGLGLIPAALVAIVVSKLMPVPSRDVLEQIREIRIPGGENIYDRELRLFRQRQLARRT